MCRPSVPVPVTNPFGTLPALPQMSIGRSAGAGPSVQYGISSLPVCANDCLTVEVHCGHFVIGC